MSDIDVFFRNKLPTPIPPSSGQVKHLFSTWEKFTNDSDILSTIRGIKFQFHTEPWQDVFPTPTRFSESECQLIDAEVQTLLDKGAIKVVSHETGEILSNIFLRPKKSGEMRPIINLRYLNEFIEHNHFKIENLDSFYP